MPPPIPTTFHCLACGMMWVRPKSWGRRYSKADSVRDHCSLGLTEFCSGVIVMMRGDLAEVALAAHRIGGDVAVTELAIGTMHPYQRLRVQISQIGRKVPGHVPESCINCEAAPCQDAGDGDDAGGLGTGTWGRSSVASTTPGDGF